MLNSLESIVAQLKAHGNEYIDDHNGGKQTGKAEVVAQHGKHVVLLHPHAKYFSINYLYVGENGRVHLSTQSVGGVLDLRQCNLQTAIAVYNNPENQPMAFQNPELTQITYL
jgi:hypothetical protein